MQNASYYTPAGMKIAGPYENARNAENAALYKAIIREACGVADIIVAHHLTYVAVETRDGFDYQVIEEIPSADTLIFDHDIARKIWGEASFTSMLVKLACEPIATRDALLHKLYYNRKG